MVEVRQIANGKALPDDEGWVLIEPIVGGGFVADGTVNLSGSVFYFTPPKFETEAEAIVASLEWAKANGVPVVHVRHKT